MEVIPPLVKDGMVTLFGVLGKEVKIIDNCIYYPISKRLIIHLLDNNFSNESLVLDPIEHSTLEMRGYSPYIKVFKQKQ